MAADIRVPIPPPYRYAFAAGYRPPAHGPDALERGDLLVVVPDKVACFGTGGGAYALFDWGPPVSGASAAPTAYPITGAAAFTAAHGLAYRPDTWLADASGEIVDTDTLHAPGAVTVIFAQPFTGTLYVR